MDHFTTFGSAQKVGVCVVGSAQKINEENGFVTPNATRYQAKANLGFPHHNIIAYKKRFVNAFRKIFLAPRGMG